MRPRFHAIAEGGKLWAIIEYDIAAAGFRTRGRSGRANLFGNRFIVDFLIPGTSLRFRFGRTDWIGPQKELMGSFVGLSRLDGYGLYGKLTGPISISLFNTKYNESNNSDTVNAATGVEAADSDYYHLRLSYKVSPALTIEPFTYFDHTNPTGAANAAGAGAYSIWWYGLHVKGKVGMLTYSASFNVQDGEIGYSRGANRPDLDVSAWASLVRIWATFGKFKLGFYYIGTSGDDSTTSADGNEGRRKNNELTRFFTHRKGVGGWVNGPQLVTMRRWNTIGMSTRGTRTATGNGGVTGNGYQIAEILGKYAVTKRLNLQGNVSLIRSSAKRQDIDANFDGDTNDAGDSTYSNAKDFATEIDLAFVYKIYKNLSLTGVFAYQFSGDYGQQATSAGAVVNPRDPDDIWALYAMLRYIF